MTGGNEHLETKYSTNYRSCAKIVAIDMPYVKNVVANYGVTCFQIRYCSIFNVYWLAMRQNESVTKMNFNG